MIICILPYTVAFFYIYKLQLELHMSASLYRTISVDHEPTEWR